MTRSPIRGTDAARALADVSARLAELEGEVRRVANVTAAQSQTLAELQRRIAELENVPRDHPSTETRNST